MRNILTGGYLSPFTKTVLLGSVSALTFGLATNPASAITVPLLTGPAGSNPAAFPADLPDVNATISAINSTGATGINPNTTAVFSNFRNYVDNGDIAIAQRGTGSIAGVSTCNVVGSTDAYVADRFCVTSNVAAQAATGQVVTSSPTPFTGFQNSMNVWRASGALTVPVCAIQEIPANDAIQLQGQTVTFSAYLQALAGLNADNGSVVNMYIITGTTADQGLQSFSAVGSTFPNWAGLVTTTTSAKTITTGWARYSLTGVIPTGAKEVGVEICFTPTATGAGSTDGFSMVGVQLEQGATPSTYAFTPLGIELTKAQEYFYRLSDVAGASQQLVGFSGFQQTSQNCSGALTFPTQMRTNPITTNTLSATSFAIVGTHLAIGSGTALSTPFSGTLGTKIPLTAASLKFTTGSGTAIVAGDTCYLETLGSGGFIDFSADF